MAVLIALSALLSSLTTANRPNIVFFLMDDIGWNDVGFNDGQFPTPNIDALADNGVSLQRHYIHLMCSPSRTQFITGRYAMYQGFGKMLPWDYTEIGGLPQGQPTVASWLKWGGYSTFGIGKWHMGYASDVLLPTAKGFDHFFGFYQGAIHYDNMKYIDIKYGDSDHFDFWEDGAEARTLTTAIEQRHEAIEKFTLQQDMQGDLTDYTGQSIYDDNTMYLYQDKVIQYIDAQKEEHNPFYMYVALQTIHGPLNEVPEKIQECIDILPEDATNRRHKYCQNMLLTDDVIGNIINKLKEDQESWENTLVVFTSDNGGDVANKGCNFPFRGTKGTLFDGNLKTLAVVAGGIIPEAQRGTSRKELFSSLDWTPTLLKFGGLLSRIEKKDYTWDGKNQYDLIMDYPNVKPENVRDHIVMNIGLKSLQSASIVFEYENTLYKYVSKDDNIDRWQYIRDDGWCVPDADGNFALVLDEDVSNARAVDNRFLFDLTNDISEKNNLLQFSDNDELVNYAKSILTTYTEHNLFSEPLPFLWNRLPAGDPNELGEGAFVAPFLNEQDYTFHLRKGFHAMDDRLEEGEESKYSKALQGTYFAAWVPPEQPSNSVLSVARFSTSSSVVNAVHISAVAVFLAALLTMFTIYKCFYKAEGDYKRIEDCEQTPSFLSA